MTPEMRKMLSTRIAEARDPDFPRFAIMIVQDKHGKRELYWINADNGSIASLVRKCLEHRARAGISRVEYTAEVWYRREDAYDADGRMPSEAREAEGVFGAIVSPGGYEDVLVPCASAAEGIVPDWDSAVEGSMRDGTLYDALTCWTGE